MGLLVALFILFSAYKAAKETLSPLLGQAPDPELVQRIRDIVAEHDTVVGIHDLVVHDYGPGRQMVSLHAEFPPAATFWSFTMSSTTSSGSSTRSSTSRR